MEDHFYIISISSAFLSLFSSAIIQEIISILAGHPEAYSVYTTRHHPRLSHLLYIMYDVQDH